MEDYVSDMDLIQAALEVEQQDSTSHEQDVNILDSGSSLKSTHTISKSSFLHSL
jgi:hypothetical protein